MKMSVHCRRCASHCGFAMISGAEAAAVRRTVAHQRSARADRVDRASSSKQRGRSGAATASASPRRPRPSASRAPAAAPTVATTRRAAGGARRAESGGQRAARRSGPSAGAKAKPAPRPAPRSKAKPKPKPHPKPRKGRGAAPAGAENVRWPPPRLHAGVSTTSAPMPARFAKPQRGLLHAPAPPLVTRADRRCDERRRGLVEKAVRQQVALSVQRAAGS